MTTSVKTGMGWDSDPEFPVADWQYEVANDDTRQGYWEWVKQNREEREIEDLVREDEAREEQIGQMRIGSLGPA